MALRFSPARGAGSLALSTAIRGPAGAAATVQVGMVTSLPSGSTPTVSNSGSTAAAVLNFGLPTTPTIAIGTTATGNAASNANVQNVGTPDAQTLNFTIPRGADSGVRYLFDTSTTMAAPAAGGLRLNNATLASVTAIAVNASNADGIDVSDFIATWDDTSGTFKGYLEIRKEGSGSVLGEFQITSVTDNTTWLQIGVTFLSGSGSFSLNDPAYLIPLRAGPPGSGSGDVVGPSSAANSNLASFDGTTGKLIKDSGKAAPSGAIVGTTDTQTLTNKTATSLAGSAASSFTATTQTARDNSTKLATTAYVDGASREKLTATRIYFVRTDGSDSNNGLTNSSGGAWLTWQKAYDVICKTLDLAGFNVVVFIADGTYNSPLQCYGGAVGVSGPASIVFAGNASSPQNVILSVTGGDAIYVGDLSNACAQISIQDFEIRTTTAGNCLNVSGGGASCNFQNIRFGTCAGVHVRAVHSCFVQAVGNYQVVGNAVAHLQIDTCGVIATHNQTVTYSNSPTFSFVNILASSPGMIYATGMTFVNGGTVTGQRYQALLNGVIYTLGGGANYFPGTVAGSIANGGQYA